MSIFHLDGGHKHEENSLRGIRRAKRGGFDEIDIDMMPDVAHNIYGCHWPDPMIRDGFRDVKRQLPRAMHLDQMTPAQVGRLRAGWFHPYRVLRIEVLIAECAHQGIGIRLEPKHPIFTRDESWQYLAKTADAVGCDVRMYALPDLSGPEFGARCVAAAKRAGIPGKVIGS